MNKQPFYHQLEVLFTATTDLTEEVNKAAFRRKLATFLRKELGKEIIASSVTVDADEEPGNPHDLMG